MNKKLVAAALGLAFAAPVFADASNVVLYGRIHQALEHNTLDVDNASSAGNGSNFANYSSRLGVRGVEDLGGGLNAIFAYEFGADTDGTRNPATSPNGGGLGSTRHAYLGMKGNFGTVVVGLQDGGNDSQAPLYNQASAYMLNINNNAGQLTVVEGNPLTNGTAATTVRSDAAIIRDQRRANAIGFATTVAGVKLSARHALAGTNQSAGDTGNGTVALRNEENTFRSTELAADYVIGALSLGAGFQAVEADQANSVDLNNDGFNSTLKNIVQFGASYKFSGFTVAGLVAQQRYYGLRDSDTQYSVSGLLPLGTNYGLQALYAASENGVQTNVGQVAPGTALSRETDVNQFQVSAYYDFSKRTRSYVGFNRSTSETVNATGALVEADSDSLVVGLRHNF